LICPKNAEHKTLSGLKNDRFSRETLTSVKNRCGVLI
jgi:hypothetical protein